jgi:hypothetical protein
MKAELPRDDGPWPPTRLPRRPDKPELPSYSLSLDGRGLR